MAAIATTAARASPASAEMSDILTWRLAGACAWHGMAFVAGYITWALAAAWLTPATAPTLLSFSSLSTLMFLCMLQAMVLFAHKRVLSASESAPVYLPALGLHGRGWLGTLVSRVLLRTRKLQDLIDTMILFASTSFTAATTLYLYSPPSSPSPAGAIAAAVPTLSFTAGYGLCLGSLYSLQHLLRCRDVLAYPSIHRHRSFMLRQRLPSCVGAAVRIGITALPLAYAAGYHAPSWSVLVSGLVTATLCVWGWLAGSEALQVVMTEPLRLATSMSSAAQDPVKALLDVMADPRPIVQDVGMQELVLLAQGHASVHKAWRAGIWKDDTGRLGWLPLSGYLNAELRDWVITLAAALPGAPGGAKAAPDVSTTVARVQWNVLALSSSTGTRVVSRPQDTAAWCMRRKLYRVGFCLRALSGLLAASRTEDRFGIVLLSQPTAGDITQLMLSCVLVAQQYTKAVSMAASSSGKMSSLFRQLLAWTGPDPHPSLQQVEVLSHMLEDTARSCVGQVAGAFGTSLLTAFKDAQTAPVYGSPAELQTLLANILMQRE